MSNRFAVFTEAHIPSAVHGILMVLATTYLSDKSIPVAMCCQMAQLLSIDSHHEVTVAKYQKKWCVGMLEPSKAERPCDKFFHFLRCGAVVLLYGIGIRHTSTHSTLRLLRHIYGL